MRTIRQRRLKKKTDYKLRLGLLKSGTPRLVIRKTNRYMIVQIVESDIAKDKVVASVTSKDLLIKGWPKENAGSLKSLPAAYLTGYILAEKVKEPGQELILDIGMHRNISQSRIYAVLKGALDAGLKVKHNEKALPTEEQINKNEKFTEIINKIVKQK
jgi:large subunit ribosomal protein L18